MALCWTSHTQQSHHLPCILYIASCTTCHMPQASCTCTCACVMHRHHCFSFPYLILISSLLKLTSCTSITIFSFQSVSLIVIENWIIHHTLYIHVIHMRARSYKSATFSYKSSYMYQFTSYNASTVGLSCNNYTITLHVASLIQTARVTANMLIHSFNIQSL